MNRFLTSFLLVSALLVGCNKDKDKANNRDNTPVCYDPTAGEQGELKVGFAQARIPAPVGIGTVGNNGVGVDSAGSPFAELFPATESVHNHPGLKAVAVTRGPGHELVFLRTDTIGVFQQLRSALVIELERRMGRNLDDALIIGATHTHSGPGRVVDAPDGTPFVIIADEFLPEFYERLIDTMADVVEEALTKAKPGRIGYAIADGTEGINDRRCEDGRDYRNGEAPVLVIEQGGEIVAAMMSLAIHGTVLGIDDLTLSQDVSGGIEQAIEDGFDHPVQVQMHNSWGADMSPGEPQVPTQAASTMPDGYDKMERVGAGVADAVHDALRNVKWMKDPMIWGRTHRVELTREAIGYAEDEFQYPSGAVYCGQQFEADCDKKTDYYPELDDYCLISFPDSFPAPMQTEQSAGQIGDLFFVTFPGEPGTLLGEKVIDGIHAQHPDVKQVWFLGYAQDYIGYSILEDDWWQGGYEAGGALWGPKQGEYLSDQAIENFGRARCTVPLDPDEPDPIEPFAEPNYKPYSSPNATDFGEVLTDVLSTYTQTDVVELVVAGDDPWHGAPIAYLERPNGNAVKRPNGMPIHSDGQAFWLHLTPDPAYKAAPNARSRTFKWEFFLPVSHSTVGAMPTLSGDYRIRVELPQAKGAPKSVVSGTFTIQ